MRTKAITKRQFDNACGSKIEGKFVAEASTLGVFAVERLVIYTHGHGYDIKMAFVLDRIEWDPREFEMIAAEYTETTTRAKLVVLND